jgi:hypothetical protein
MVFNTVGEEKRALFLKYFSFNKNIENDRFRCCPYCYNSFNFFSRSDAAEEKLAQTSSYLQDCLSKQLFIEKHKVTGQNIDIYTFQMILQFVVKAFEEESSLLLPEFMTDINFSYIKMTSALLLTVTKICPNCYTSLN